jgi:hypothetical protein
VTDPDTGQPSADWQRSRAIRDHLQWVRSQLFKMAYSGRSERTVLRKESDWILKRDEQFIKGFSGEAPPKTKKRLKEIYLLLNRLSNVPSACGKLARIEAKIAKTRADDKYKDLEPNHRARLIAEDIAELHTEMTRWHSYISSALVEVRSGFAALGVPVR